MGRFVELAASIKSRPRLAWILSASLLPALNAALSILARFTLPFFMDSIFTALAAAVFGLWPGILVAVVTNSFHELIHGFPGLHLPFALCGIATALIVDAFARGQRRDNPVRILLCIGAVAIANSILGAIIATFVFGGGTGVNIDNIVSGLALILDSLITAAFLARIPINLVDKAIAVLPALLLASAVGRAGGSGDSSAGAGPREPRLDR